MTTKFLLSSDDNTRSGLLKKKIIHYYMANGDATIAEVCKEMNLSIPTVTKLISELQEDGYILDFGKQETSGGRKPSIYGLNPVSMLGHKVLYFSEVYGLMAHSVARDPYNRY